jgi:hypothetical protein
MKILPSGTYRFIAIPADPSQPVTVTNMTVGGDVPPPPPPPSDFRAKVQNALTKVTDPTASTTAAALSQTYAEFSKAVEAGSITTVEQLHTAVKTVTAIITISKPSWSTFAQVMDENLVTCGDVTACNGLLKIVIEELDKARPLRRVE